MVPSYCSVVGEVLLGEREREREIEREREMMMMISILIDKTIEG